MLFYVHVKGQYCKLFKNTSPLQTSPVCDQHPSFFSLSNISRPCINITFRQIPNRKCEATPDCQSAEKVSKQKTPDFNEHLV